MKPEKDLQLKVKPVTGSTVSLSRGRVGLLQLDTHPGVASLSTLGFWEGLGLYRITLLSIDVLSVSVSVLGML